MTYEYAVWGTIDDCIHRGPWSEDECVAWIEECREVFPPTANIDKVWSVRQRAVGAWEPHNPNDFTV